VKTTHKMIRLDELVDNALSGNVEDNRTFRRLKQELAKWGMLQPVLVKPDNGKYRIIAGHHRARAWAELGYEDIPAIVVDGDMTPEDEFNLVNNLNLVRGEISLRKLRQAVRRMKLSPKKIDLHGIRVEHIVPEEAEEFIQRRESDLERQIRLETLKIQLAREIAPYVEENKEAMLWALAVRDRVLVVVVRDEDIDMATARKAQKQIKQAMSEAWKEWKRKHLRKDAGR